MTQRTVKQIQIRLDFSDGTRQEFTTEDPEDLSLDVAMPVPEPIGHAPDLSRIPIDRSARVDLRFKTRAKPLTISHQNAAGRAERVSDFTHFDGGDLNGIGGPVCGASADSRLSLDWALVDCPDCHVERP